MLAHVKTKTALASLTATAAVAAIMLGTSTVAQSAPVNETTGNLEFFSGGTNSEGLQNFEVNSFTITGSFTRTLTGLPSNIAGNADVTLTAQGDFFSSVASRSANENVSLDIDGISLGTFLNDNPHDDEFDNSSFGDEGLATASDGNRSAAASVDLGNALNDGELDLTYTFTSAGNVDDLTGTDYVRTDISYQTTATSVPIPASIALFGVGLISLGIAVRGRLHT